MSPDSKNALKLLRCEMMAVNQQFIHILSLRHWGHRDIAERIVEVDDIDFPNAMKIVDYLVENNAPFDISGDCFQPGHDLFSVIAAEAEMERRLNKILDNCDFENSQLSKLLEVAQGPRKAYSGWLKVQIDGVERTGGSNPDFAKGLAKLTGHLLAVIEQAMIHAFVHFYQGRSDLADAAWHTSGAAMMQLTRFVSICAARNSAIIIDEMPSLFVEYDTGRALGLDREIAFKCADLSRQAGKDSSDDKVKQYCRDLEIFHTELSNFAEGSVHPAISTNPPAFASFEATLKRFGLR